jgi:hypothetical protein
MVNHVDDLGCKHGLSCNLLDIVSNLLVVVKLQQLNIELLWEAYTSGKPSADGLAKVRESNLRLVDTMEQMVGVIMASSQVGSFRPD